MTTKTITITRTYDAKNHEWTVTADGDEIFTAHCANVAIGMWSVKRPTGNGSNKLIGLAQTEDIATATLDKLAAKFADTLRAAGLTVEVG